MLETAGCNDEAVLLLPRDALGEQDNCRNQPKPRPEEEDIVGHKQAQAELPLSLVVLAFDQRCCLKSKLSLMTQDMKIQG